MVLIAFCAIALVANVTNAQPVGGETIGEGGGGREGQEETKQDKRFGQLVMNPQKTHYSTKNGNSQAHRTTLTC